MSGIGQRGRFGARLLPLGEMGFRVGVPIGGEDVPQDAVQGCGSLCQELPKWNGGLGELWSSACLPRMTASLLGAFCF